MSCESWIFVKENSERKTYPFRFDFRWRYLKDVAIFWQLSVWPKWQKEHTSFLKNIDKKTTTTTWQNKSNKKKKRKSEGSKGWDEVIGWTIWVFLVCFEKYFGRNCFWQSYYGGCGVTEILNEQWKWQNIKITLFCAKFSLVLPDLFLAFS